MSRHDGYERVMARRAEIVRDSIGLDYEKHATGVLAFDYEGLLADTGYDLETVREIQLRTAVGGTPLVELRNLTELVRSIADPGRGARIFVKDEAANPSGSFKDRRASISAHEAKRRGFAGIAAATSGNYGAAVASQAAKAGLRCIIVQEAFDSRGIAQPEIAEKTRACEAYGAEVMRLSVGPELFYVFLVVLEETGFFNASLYTPYSILGIETLGAELALQSQEQTGRFPDVVLTTHAGGGNVTGTARGLQKAGASATSMIGVSVDLSGLHMASDRDFNRKSFTTGHTGFSMPFTTWPDRADVPRNAARALRYLDRFVTVTQGRGLLCDPGAGRARGHGAWSGRQYLAGRRLRDRPRDGSRRGAGRAGDGVHRRGQAPPGPAGAGAPDGHPRSARRSGGECPGCVDRDPRTSRSGAHGGNRSGRGATLLSAKRRGCRPGRPLARSGRHRVPGRGGASDRGLGGGGPE